MFKSSSELILILMGFKSHDLRDMKNFGGRPRFWEPQIFNPNADKGDF